MDSTFSAFKHNAFCGIIINTMGKIAGFWLVVFIVPLCAYAEIQPVSFPKTFEDLSFQDKVAVKTEAYQPFMDKSVYQSLEIAPGEEIYTDRTIAELEAEQPTTPTTDFPTFTDDTSGYTFPSNETPVQPTTVTQYNGTTIGGGAVIENNIVINGSCYPAATDATFPNKIYTTGKYESISPAFEKAMITVFRKEGSCGTIKNDPCGYTCYGVGSSPKCAGVVVKNRAEAEEFYYSRYWQKYHYGRLPDVISGDIFLASMGSGPVTAIRQFAKFLGIKRTDSINNEMITAVQNYNGDIHNRWLDVRNEFLQKVARERYNGSVSRGYKNAIRLKRNNGCHVRPAQMLTR